MLEYTPEIGDKICNRMVAGDSMDKICKRIKKLQPSMVFGWIHKGERRLDDPDDLYADFVTKYRLARESQAEAALDKILEIEQDVREGVITAPVANALIKSLQWRAQICRPERYIPKERRDVNLTANVDPWAELMNNVTKDNSDRLENQNG